MAAIDWLAQMIARSELRSAQARRRGIKLSRLESLEDRRLLSGLAIQVTNGNANGAGSLAAAISKADLNPGSTISFAHNVTTVNLASSTLPAITTSMTINGPHVTVKQSGAPIFDITAGTVVISGLTMNGGNAEGGDGGAVYDDSSSTVTLQNDTFTSNTAAFGGAVFGDLLAGSLVISCCTFTGNTASSGGAVAYQGVGSVAVANSTFTHNTANDSQGDGAEGGAIAIGSFASQLPAPTVRSAQHLQVTSTATLSVSCSTFSYNVADATTSDNTLDGDEADGGAIFVDPSTGTAGVQPALAGPSTAVTNITGSTFTYNTAQGGAGRRRPEPGPGSAAARTAAPCQPTAR